MKRLAVLVMLGLSATPSPRLVAQDRRGGGLRFSLSHMGSLRFTADDSLILGAGGSMVAGVAVTAGISPSWGFRIGVSRTLGQRYDLSAPAFGVPVLEGKMSTTQLGVSVLLAPPRRRPRDPALYFEVGAGLLMTQFGVISVRTIEFAQNEFNTYREKCSRSARPYGTDAGPDGHLRPRSLVA